MSACDTCGIVGESGSGKSVTALSVMRLIRAPGKIIGGKVTFAEMDLIRLPQNRMRSIRGNRISMIFQEPMTSLNPLLTVGRQIAEMFLRHKKMNRKESLEKSEEMLERVQIPVPSRTARKYPHELSGGMRQRAMIAMALACNPEILIADEPTTALDVTVQAQVTDLMLRLNKEYNAGIMIITHDLGVVAEMAQRAVVRYAGQVMEVGDILSIFQDPKHPYTRALLQAVPKLGEPSQGRQRRLYEIKGIVPSLLNPPVGCHFHPRCPDATGICRQESVPLRDLGGGRKVRCLL